MVSNLPRWKGRPVIKIINLNLSKGTAQIVLNFHTFRDNKMVKISITKHLRHHSNNVWFDSDLNRYRLLTLNKNPVGFYNDSAGSEVNPPPA
jgi:hypothetical protein